MLAQLGNRVQHALRAFTPQDADNLAKAARTFPISKDYDVEQSLQALGIGEAFVTVLSPRGVPTPLAWTILLPPDSLMAALDAEELQRRIAASPLTAKYAEAVDRESAHEMIAERIKAAEATADDAAAPTGKQPGKSAKAKRDRAKPAPRRTAPPKPAPEPPDDEGGLGGLLKAGEKFAKSSSGQAMIRGALGTLFHKS